MTTLWPCTDPAYRKDGDEMTWTCRKCKNVNPSGKCMCLKCSSGRITGLSLEDLVAPLKAENAKLRERVRELEEHVRDLDNGNDHLIRKVGTESARVRELEAECNSAKNALQKKDKRISELEAQRDEMRSDLNSSIRDEQYAAKRVRDLEGHLDAANRVHVELGKRYAELEAQLKSTLNIVDTWWNWAVGLFGGKTDLDGNGMREKIKAQLAQAQKPAAPDSAANVCTCGHRWAEHKPNQAACGLCEKCNGFEPAAPQPSAAPDGVTMENFDRLEVCGLKMFGGLATGPLSPIRCDVEFVRKDMAREACEADIRAAVTAEREKLDARITGLEEALERVRQERERVRRDLMGQRDAALAEGKKYKEAIEQERDDLRAKLEAAEKVSARRREAIESADETIASLQGQLEAAEKASAARIAELKEFNQGLGTRLDASEKLSEQRRLQIFDLHMAADIGQLVDRERAIAAVRRVIVNWNESEQGDQRCAELAVDAILGTAKAEPPAFTPAPTGEAPSEERKHIYSLYGFSTKWEQLPRNERNRHINVFCAVYALIAADHARLAKENSAMVKRARELESMVNGVRRDMEATAMAVGLDRSVGVVEIVRKCHAIQADVERLTSQLNLERDQWNERLASEVTRLVDAEKERLKAAASQPRRCPADGMHPREVGHAIHRAVYPESGGFEGYDAGGAKARELFTPAAPAKDESTPQVGDRVTVKIDEGKDSGPEFWNLVVDKARLDGQSFHAVDDNSGKEVWVQAATLGKTWWWSDSSAKGAE